MSLRVVPITFKDAGEYVRQLHRHNKPPVGCKFCIAVEDEGRLCGVAMCGRPVNRHLDDKFTLEVNRTCTDGTLGANSCLYAACRVIAKAMGYRRLVTYTQKDESGTSLKVVGFVKAGERKARKSWAESSKQHRIENGFGGPGKVPLVKRDGRFGGVDRVLWEIRFNG